MLRRSALVALRRRTADGGAGTALLSAARGHAAAAAKVDGAATAAIEEARVPEGVASGNFCAASPKDVLEVLVNPNGQWGLNSRTNWMSKGLSKNEGILDQFMSHSRRYRRVAGLQDLSQLSKVYTNRHMVLTSMRAFSSAPSSGSEGTRHEETRKDLTTSEDPFDAPTYNIPEKPVTFAEGASYSVVILLGLGVAAAAAYAVFKELIFEPKEYKIFGKALDRVQNDSQVRVRIGSPVTGYGQESRNRAARQRIPHKTWTDEDGVEHVEVNFFVRGPHGAGKVYSEMFKDKDDKQWKFTYLIVDITSPSQSRLMLESYIPA